MRETLTIGIGVLAILLALNGARLVVKSGLSTADEGSDDRLIDHPCEYGIFAVSILSFATLALYGVIYALGLVGEFFLRLVGVL